MATLSTARPARAERLSPKAGVDIDVYGTHLELLGRLLDISVSGLRFAPAPAAPPLELGAAFAAWLLPAGGHLLGCGVAAVARSAHGAPAPEVALKFGAERPALIEELQASLLPPRYVSGELRADALAGVSSTLDGTSCTIDRFYEHPSPDILEKCAKFRPWVDDLQLEQLYQRMWRVTLTSALDHEVTVFDPIRRVERSMVCFDSNSYLGLHRHPRVIERCVEVLRREGYGTPSAQLLGGTNRHLRELEQELSEFLGRDETIIFPTGFAANVGALAALLRRDDAVVRDRFSHASIHEGCKGSSSRFSRVFAHNDMGSLGRVLGSLERAGCAGKLIVTDGVFSMHGRIAPLPELVRVAREHSARLMVDDAHGLGVLGESGRGIEEHFGMPGSVDVLMGTLSKALGGLGGFVSGSRDLINYLRFFAPSGMFTTSLPSATCAGVREALRVSREEPEHRQRLWQNIRLFAPALADAGFVVPEPVSPIATVFLGDHRLMLDFSRELFDAGIKCGNVMYPVVAKGEAILRFTLNARHTREEIENAVDVLRRLGKKWGILRRSREEICAIGARAELGRTHAAPCLQ